MTDLLLIWDSSAYLVRMAINLRALMPSIGMSTSTTAQTAYSSEVINAQLGNCTG